MTQRKYICKLDKWLSEKPFEESWSGAAFTLLILLIIYPLMYFGPEIIFYLQGYVQSPSRHKFTMMWFNTLCIIILFFTILKIIRLIRKKY